MPLPVPVLELILDRFCGDFGLCGPFWLADLDGLGRSGLALDGTGFCGLELRGPVGLGGLDGVPLEAWERRCGERGRDFGAFNGPRNLL